MNDGVNVGILSTGFCDGIGETVCIISVRVGSDDGIDDCFVVFTFVLTSDGVLVGAFVVRSLVVFSFEGFDDAVVKSLICHAGLEFIMEGACEVKLEGPGSVEVLVIGRNAGACDGVDIRVSGICGAESDLLFPVIGGKEKSN